MCYLALLVCLHVRRNYMYSTYKFNQIVDQDFRMVTQQESIIEKVDETDIQKV